MKILRHALFGISLLFLSSDALAQDRKQQQLVFVASHWLLAHYAVVQDRQLLTQWNAELKVGCACLAFYTRKHLTERQWLALVHDIKTKMVDGDPLNDLTAGDAYYRFVPPAALQPCFAMIEGIMHKYQRAWEAKKRNAPNKDRPSPRKGHSTA